MRVKLTIVAAVLMALFATFAGTANAQETRGTIRGTVTDPNGQPVLNATVVVTDVPRGTKTTLTTNGEGFYQALFLLPSTYQITVEANGFKKAIRENVVIQIADAINANMRLEVGGAEETVTVTSALPNLNTENASLGQVVDQQRLAELPLANGDPYKLIGTAAGVGYQGDERLDRPYEPTHIVGYSVNGVRSNRMDLTVDGIASTATANGNEVTASYVPPSDIVQEFKVQTATFDAQFGNTEGSVTSIVIKSGTNDFHGSAYSFWQPSAIGANDAFGKARGEERVNSKSDRFGGYIGGPIKFPWLYNGKDKSFFLFGIEYIDDARPRYNVDARNYSPIDALRSGDFSAFRCPNDATTQPTPCTNIYDPYTRVVQSGTTYISTQFSDPTRGTPTNPGGLNIIPTSRLNPVALAILDYMGQPKNPGLLNNLNDSSLLETTDYYNWTFRVDQQLTSKNRLFVRGSWYTREGLYNRYTDSAYAGQNFSFLSRGGVIDDVHTFNSSTFLNLKYGYNRFIRWQQSQDDAVGFDLTQLWGAQQGAAYNSLIGETVRRFPRIEFPTPGPLSSNTVTNEIRPTDTHNAVAILNKTWGTHSFKFGGELRIYRENQNQQNQNQTGNFVFNNTYTRRSTATSGVQAGPQELNGLQAFASFLLGLPTTQSVVRAADYSEYSKTWGFFVQDDFRIGSRLTINAGLRYEKEEALAERQNKSVSGFDFDYTQPSQAQVRANATTSPIIGLDGVPLDPNSINLNGGLLFASDTGKLYNTPNNTFLPRFGLAYRLSDRTVLRGGMGLFAGFLGQRRSDVIQPGFTRTTTLATTTLASGAAIPFPIQDFPTRINILEPVGDADGPQTGLGGAIAFFNQNPKPAKQLRWQFGVQHEFSGGLMVEAAYVGNYGYDIEITQDINAIPSRYLIAGDLVNGAESAAVVARTLELGRDVRNPFQNLYPGGSLNPGNGLIDLNILLRRFPHYGANSVLTTNNDGKTWFNSGQFGITKRFSTGSTIQASYTWSKWTQAVEYLNTGDEAPTKMISDQDIPHRFSISGVYKIPVGKGQPWSIENAILDGFIGGWSLNGNYQIQSGNPIAFGTFGFTGNANGQAANNMYYVGGEIAIDNPTPARWFNPDAFSRTLRPGAGQLRTLPFRFSSVRRDIRNNLDLSLMKYINFTETMKFQIRLEALNALNRVYLPAPASNDPISQSFGVVSANNQANYPRRFQIGLKFLF